MKKLLAIALIFVLAMSLLTACGDKAIGTWNVNANDASGWDAVALHSWTISPDSVGDPILGTWVFSAITLEGETLTAADFGVSGMALDLSYIFYQDGTCQLSSDGEVENGTWIAAGDGSYMALEGGSIDTLTLDGEVLTYTASDGSIDFVRDGEAVTGGMSQVAALTFNVNGTVSGTLDTDINGSCSAEDDTYTLPGGYTAKIADDILYVTDANGNETLFLAGDAAAPDSTLTVTLNKDGTASGNLFGQEAAGTWAVENGTYTITLAGQTATATMEDNALCVQLPGGTLYFNHAK